MSPGQQLVQLGDHPGVVFAQRPAAAGQDPQHRQLLVIGDLAQAGHPGSGQGDRMRVGRVGLAALPGSEDAGAGRQLGGTSTTLSPPASSRLARCRPMRWQPSIAQVRSGHCFTAASMAWYPAGSVPYRPPPTTVSSLVMISIVADRLCGSIPMTTWLIRPPRSCCHLPGKEGTATSS
jgi:hypothetical protein